MLSPDQLRKIYGEVFGVPADEVTEAARIKGAESMERAKLAAIIERHLGKKVPAAYTARTLRELEDALFGSNAETPVESAGAGPAQISRRVRTVEGFRCGIDLEPVASMPATLDYLVDPFYTATFTPAEIVYCAAQESPAMHFAARWCAKEALRKCDPGFATADHTAIELVGDENGSIFLRHRSGDGGAVRLPHAVSVTHTAEMAAATVVVGWGAAAPPNPSIPVSAPALHDWSDRRTPIHQEVMALQVPAASKICRVSTLLATLALIVVLVTSAKVFGLF